MGDPGEVGSGMALLSGLWSCSVHVPIQICFPTLRASQKIPGTFTSLAGVQGIRSIVMVSVFLMGYMPELIWCLLARMLRHLPKKTEKQNRSLNASSTGQVPVYQLSPSGASMGAVVCGRPGPGTGHVQLPPGCPTTALCHAEGVNCKELHHGRRPHGAPAVAHTCKGKALVEVDVLRRHA